MPELKSKQIKFVLSMRVATLPLRKTPATAARAGSGDEGRNRWGNAGSDRPLLYGAPERPPEIRLKSAAYPTPAVNLSPTSERVVSSD